MKIIQGEKHLKGVSGYITNFPLDNINSIFPVRFSNTFELHLMCVLRVLYTSGLISLYHLSVYPDP